MRIFSAPAWKRCSHWFIHQSVVQTYYKCNYTRKLDVNLFYGDPQGRLVIVAKHAALFKYCINK